MSSIKAGIIQAQTIYIANINNIVPIDNSGDAPLPSLQDELDKKEPLIKLPPFRLVVSNNNGKLVGSEISATEASYLQGVRSNIQEQIDDTGIHETILAEDTNTRAEDDVLHVYEAGLIGSSWKAAAEINGVVRVIHVMGTDVYVGGQFYAERIAKYDTLTNEWTALGMNGLDGEPNCMAHIGTDLYIGGNFGYADSVQAGNIVRYNTVTNTWSPLPNYGTDDAITSICAVGTNLYMSGYFQNVGGIPAKHMAK